MIDTNEGPRRGLVSWSANGLLSHSCRYAGHRIKFRLIMRGDSLLAGLFLLAVIVASRGIQPGET